MPWPGRKTNQANSYGRVTCAFFFTKHLRSVNSAQEEDQGVKETFEAKQTRLTKARKVTATKNVNIATDGKVT